jgi:acetylornithine deacetylase/succinyl-diaminopimelate desuccinylase-like protein
MADLAEADSYVEEQYDEFLADLRELVAQPSVSRTGRGIEECAGYLESLCSRYGFGEVDVVGTDWHPAVVARAYVDGDPAAAEEHPTLLVYGHYDVQPVDPERWETPPFDPVVEDGPDGERYLYGRGSVDNKGQFHTHVAAVRAFRATVGLPVNVTLLLDGEEESGSPSMPDVVDRNADRLDADLAINSDGPVDESGRPHVVFGNRGLVQAEVNVAGADRDLHSGHNGGAVPNPAWKLLRLLNTMRDDDGRIAIDGFYEDVRGVTDRDREALEAMPLDEAELRAAYGVERFDHGPGESFFEKVLFYPTLNVSGISSGHPEGETKTIVPSRAHVTVDMRLVADQDPDDVWAKFADHVEAHSSDRVTTDVRRHSAYRPNRTPLDSPFADPIVEAVDAVWEREPIVKPLTGGSAPYAVFADELGVDHIKVPYGQRANNQHSPDEHYSLDHHRRGILTNLRLYDSVAGA